LRGRGWWHCRQPGQVEVALEDGLSIVRLLGEHDLSTQQIVAAKLAALIEAGNPLVFDVTQATFIDSTVVNAVVRAGSALAARGVPVALVVPDSASRGVSKLIGLVEQKVAIVRSPAEAKQLLLSARQAD
jgi:anti-sigma B factor antagonist